MYRIFDHTTNTGWGCFDSLKDAKECLEYSRGTGHTMEIFHLDKDLNTVTDFFVEEM